MQALIGPARSRTAGPSALTIAAWRVVQVLNIKTILLLFGNFNVNLNESNEY